MSFRKPGSDRVVVVAIHAGTLKKGTVSGILRDAGISVEQFIEIYEKKYGIRFMLAWGMTETTPIASVMQMKASQVPSTIGSGA